MKQQALLLLALGAIASGYATTHGNTPSETKLRGIAGRHADLVEEYIDTVTLNGASSPQARAVYQDLVVLGENIPS